MITFFAMSLYGAAMTAVILLLRRLFIGVMPKRTFKILWLLTAARLLVPLFIPLPIYVKAAAEVTGEAVSKSVPKLLIFAVWAAGAAVSAGIFAAAYIKTLRKFRAAKTVHSSELSRVIGGFGLRRRVEMRVCKNASSPVTYGLFRPGIILPENFSEYDMEQISCAVLHEMQHIVSLDALYKPIIAAAACLHWFNPAAWAMLIMAGRDAEIACDEAVLEKIGGEKREEYALALLACEERRGGMPATQAFAKNAVKERIELIMKYKKSAAAAVIAAIAVVGCTAAVFALLPQFRTETGVEPYSDSGETDTEQGHGVVVYSNGVVVYSNGAETDTDQNNGVVVYSDGVEPVEGEDADDGIRFDVRATKDGITVNGKEVEIPPDNDWELTAGDDTVYIVFSKKDDAEVTADDAADVTLVRQTVNIDGTEFKLPPKANYGEIRSVPEGERSSGEDAARLLEACFDGAEDFSYPVDSAYNGGYSYTGGFTIPAQKGEDVCSMLDGRVVYADMSFPFGNAAVIDHGGGNVWLYAHCSDLCVSEGDDVKSGDIIGHVGSTGATPDNRLYVYKY